MDGSVALAAARLNGGGDKPRPYKQDYFFSAGMALEGVFVDLPSMATFHF